MKKLFLLVLVFALTNCEIKVQTKQTQAQTTTVKPVSQEIRNEVIATTFTKDGIEYVVFTVYANGNGGRAVHVVNHTKEQLEVEKLQYEKSHNRW